MVYLCPHRKFLLISGIDTEKYLQGLTSNDMKKLKNHSVIYSLFLDTKGKYKFDCFIWKIEENMVVIEVHESQYDDLKKWLGFYKLQADLQIQEAENYEIYISEKRYENFVQDPRKDFLYRSLRDRSAANLFEESQTFDYMDFRLKHLIVETEDLRGGDTPMDVGLDDLKAISYEKGCYLGQEGANKAKHLDKRKKKMIYFTSNKDFEIDTELFIGNQKSVGSIRYFYQGQGLALISVNKEDKIKGAYPEINIF